MDPGQEFVEAFQQSLFARFRGLGDPFLEGCVRLGTRLVFCSFSRRDPARFTLECSRPALGPYTVMASLNAIGLNGWQILVGRSLELAQRLKQRLEALDYCKVLNLDTLGPSVVWWVLPPGRNAKEIYLQVTP